MVEQPIRCRPKHRVWVGHWPEDHQRGFAGDYLDITTVLLPLAAACGTSNPPMLGFSSLARVAFGWWRTRLPAFASHMPPATGQR